MAVILLLTVELLVSACADTRGRETFTVRDSAGVQIVESQAPEWAEGEGWRVIEPPLAQIGVTEGDERYQLFEVGQATRLSDGTILVLNEGTQEIRFYDSQGQYLRRAGGRGQGPGEFTVLEFIAVVPGDTILAYNRIPPQLVVLTADGSYVRTEAVPIPKETKTFVGIVMAAGMLSGSRLVLNAHPIYGFQVDFIDGPNRAPVPVGIANVPLQRFDSIIAAPGFEALVQHWGNGGVRYSQMPFHRAADILARDSSIWVAPNDDYTVRVHNADGRLVRLIRVQQAPVPVTSDHVASYKAAFYARYPNADRAEFERSFAASPTPETLPAYEGIDVDRGGNLWVHAYPLPGSTGPDSVRVFGTDGRWLGDLELPRGIKRLGPGQPFPMEIGDDWILGIWTDELDVDYVRLYRLQKN